MATIQGKPSHYDVLFVKDPILDLNGLQMADMLRSSALNDRIVILSFNRSSPLKAASKYLGIARIIQKHFDAPKVYRCILLLLSDIAKRCLSAFTQWSWAPTPRP
jgi:hypothetical protein